MRTRDVLRVLDDVRRAGAAAAAYRRAVQTARAGEDGVVPWREVERAWRRAETAASRRAGLRPVLSRWPAPGDRRRVTGVVLDRLADGPVELMRAADAVCVQSSGGKDSAVALDRAVEAARSAGCVEKLVVVHAHLGEDAEWPGVEELARRQAARYGLPLVTVAADGGFTGMVAERGRWPDAARRLCTARLKRDAAAPEITAVVDALGLDEQAVVLNVFGIRAAESPFRAGRPRLALDERATSGRRMVLAWNVVHRLSEAEVWREIAERGLEYHEVYDAGLERLSCALCVIAGREWLVRAARVCFALGLAHPQVYVALEARIGHDFKHGLPISDVVARARELEAVEGPLTWRRGDALRRHVGEEAAEAYLLRLAADRSVPLFV
ncbi:phosphoadenosine phosphosulfate reductase family protein [Streptomyces sp. TR02-1]|uniref:phosphoadenosine phosphosulfate reductase domain-containing protein n=1 Tax=Streptomyces sp. TR02-1 TaxID=3385977 RepID=UPI0039A3A259